MPKKQKVESVIRQSATLDWVTVNLLISLACFVASKYFFAKRFSDFIVLPINNKYFALQGKNDEINHPFNVLLFIAQILCLSLFIYLFFEYYNPQIVETNNFLFLQICTAYTVFVLVKFSIEKIIGNVFSIDVLINQYLYQKLSYRNFMALVIFVGNLLFYYAVPPTKLGLLFFVSLLVLSNAIALFNSYKKMATIIWRNFIYFILYLCALEIAPYILLFYLVIKGN